MAKKANPYPVLWSRDRQAQPRPFQLQALAVSKPSGIRGGRIAKPSRTGVTPVGGGISPKRGPVRGIGQKPSTGPGGAGVRPPGYDDLMAQIDELLASGGEGMTAPPQVPTGGGGGRTRIPSELLGALGTDVRAQQGAADRQYGRNEAATSMFRQFLEGELGTVGDRLAGGLDGVFGGIERGAERAGAMGDPGGGVGRAEMAAKEFGGDADLAKREMLGAVGDAKKGAMRAELAGSELAGNIAALGGEVERDMAAVASAIRRDAQSQLAMAKSGMHPDGTPMTSAERTDVMLRVQGETSARVFQAVQPIASRWHELKAGMQSQLAAVRQQAAQARLQAAQLRAGVGEAIGGLAGGKLQADSMAVEARFRAEQQKQAWWEMAASVKQMRETLKQAAVLRATELETQGLLSFADLVRSNPETVVSRFQGLLAVYAASAAMRGTTNFS